MFRQTVETDRAEQMGQEKASQRSLTKQFQSIARAKSTAVL